MSLELPDRLVSTILERRALLWICQRAELAADSEVHLDSTPLDDAVRRYRSTPDEEDLALAGLFWEACWTESIVDRFYDANSEIISTIVNGESSSQRRMPYRLSTDPDRAGQIDRRRFLPIYEINGTDRSGDPEGQHGTSLARRMVYRMNLMRRLEDFPGRSIVVVGATEGADLEMLKLAFDFMPSDNTVVILWPSEQPVPEDSETPSRLDVKFLRGTRADLVDALERINAPKHSGTPKLGVRYGRSSLELREEDLVGVDQEFVLIQDNDFETQFSTDEGSRVIDRLWRADADDWLPFASGMIFRRHYSPFERSDSDLADYIVSQLQDLSGTDRAVNATLTIPATSGSGITTALRHAAFLSARSGYPALMCKPANRRFSAEKLGAFLTRLQERCREQTGRAEDIPALVIFDRQHSGIEQISELATNLSVRGRRALVIEVIPPLGPEHEGSPGRRPRGRHSIAREFRGIVEETELQDLSEHFSDLYAPLGVTIPGFSAWITYQEMQTVQTLTGELAPESLFWVALRFFVGEGNPHFDLAEWVGRTFEERIRSPQAKLAVRYIAAFSSFGIGVPLAPLLRSLGTTKMLDLSIIPTLREASESEDLLQWEDTEEHIYDQTISFKHRLISIQLLNYLGVTRWENRLRECWGLLDTLEASSEADNWLVEALVFEVLRVERPDTAMLERLSPLLETFEHVPSVIAGGSAPTQHHWARALGLKASNTEDTSEKILYYSEAVGKLSLACELAERERGGEHPRNIYNSLGVMRSDLSRTLRSAGQMERAQALWQSAASAFEMALGYGADNFVVLSAYARRLIDHAKENNDPSEELSDIVSALSYLTQAEESALLTDSLSNEDANYIELERNRAFGVIGAGRAKSHISELIEQGNEIGIVLRAYEILREMNPEDWKQGSAFELEHAFDLLYNAYSEHFGGHSWRTIFLLYRVTSALMSRKYDFQLRLELLDELDALPFRWHSGLRFAQAVLCYQTGNFARGFNLFRDLRSSFASGDLQPIYVSSFWRDPQNPSDPQFASVRIRRVQTGWVAYGEVPELNGQQVVTRPRWFEVQPKTGDVRQCHIVFEQYGPLAVPVERRVVSLID